MYELYLTCPRGLESVLKDELQTIINSEIEIDKGGVKFKGTKEDIYKINYLSRIGMYLLVKVFETKVANINQLYKQVYNYNWHELISPDQTFIIKNKTNSKIFNNQNFITLKIKDAIVDRIQKEKNKRPYINKKNPDYYIHTYIHDNSLKVFLNSSGKPLFMRGYKSKIHKASLNESLASGIIKLSNWDIETPLYDFMCGSGTICIEAAMLACKIPPGIIRNEYAFLNWDDYDNQLWANVKKETLSKINYKKLNIFGSDIISQNITLAMQSATNLKINELIKFKTCDFKKILPETNTGTIIINPPYGKRIGEFLKLQKLYQNIGNHFKTYFSGYDAYLFTGNLELLKNVGLRTKQKIILKNGKIDCRLAFYPLKSGKY